MQTLPLNRKLAMQSVQHLPNTRAGSIPLPLVAPLGGPAAKPKQAASPQAPGVAQQVQVNNYAELDAMLIQDPNMGAVNGLRVALLFNAGLALSGLLVWELWSLLAA